MKVRNSLLPLMALTALACTACQQLNFHAGEIINSRSVQTNCTQTSADVHLSRADLSLPQSSCTGLEVAKSNLANGNYPEAAENFRADIETLTRDPSRRADLQVAWFGLAAAYDDQRRFTEADKAYAIIRSSFGEDMRYFNNYGYSLYLRGNFVDAERQFRAALAIKPNDERVLANLDMVTTLSTRQWTTPVDEIPVVPFSQDAGDGQPARIPIRGSVPQ